MRMIVVEVGLVSTILATVSGCAPFAPQIYPSPYRAVPGPELYGGPYPGSPSPAPAPYPYPGSPSPAPAPYGGPYPGSPSPAPAPYGGPYAGSPPNVEPGPYQRPPSGPDVY